MLFCLLEYQQMFKHMENIWEKNASLFLTMKGGGGGGGGGFFFTDPKCMVGGGGGAAENFCQLWRNFQLARV